MKALTFRIACHEPQLKYSHVTNLSFVITCWLPATLYNKKVSYRNKIARQHLCQKKKMGRCPLDGAWLTL